MIQTVASGTPLELVSTRRRGITVSSSPTSAFTPTSIAGLALWLKADAGTSTTTDGAAISQWSDQSGAGNHATQATGANQPLYKAAVINGLPVVRFDGSNDQLNVAGITNNTAARTIFLVLKDISSTLDKLLFSLMGAASNAAAIWQSSTGVYSYEKTQAAGVVAFGSALETQALLCLRYNSTTSADAFFNSGAATNFDPDDGYQSGGIALTIGTGFGTFWNGDFGEVLVYNAALTNTDVDRVRTYLKGRWNTP